MTKFTSSRKVGERSGFRNGEKPMWNMETIRKIFGSTLYVTIHICVEAI